MSSDEKEYDEKKIAILEEILKWLKVTSIPTVKKLLQDMLDTDEEKLAYHFSDGHSSQEVANNCGASYVTVTKWWKKWARAGLAESVGVKGGERAKRVFSLEDFGIELPKMKDEMKEK